MTVKSTNRIAQVRSATTDIRIHRLYAGNSVYDYSEKLMNRFMAPIFNRELGALGLAWRRAGESELVEIKDSMATKKRLLRSVRKALAVMTPAPKVIEKKRSEVWITKLVVRFYKPQIRRSRATG
jgi:hypothetical protein